jgi:hypothetical protein
MNKKDLLAKLLSTENITVLRQPVATASFNIENRVLTLPVWKNLSENIENMLIAHEVGHALYTPFRDKETIEFLDNKLLHSWANVIEDVRIEKKIQNEYPGLKKDFTSAYKELIDRNFFGVKGRDLSKEQFINKANLFYKAGYNCGVKFTAEEYGYIKEMDKCETFDDVMVLARKLTAYSIAKNELEKQALEKLAALYLGKGDDNEQGDQLKESFKDLIMDEIEDGMNGTESVAKPNVSENDVLNTVQDNFDKMLSKHTSNNEFVIIDYTPKFVGFDPYVPYTKYMADVDNWLAIRKNQEDIELSKARGQYGANFQPWDTTEDKIRIASSEFKTYLQETKKEVNYLLKEFEMRKSANQYYKTKEHKTGVIDIRKLASYKIKEEIFKTIQSLPKGKNHGMVMLMDWSGSMSSVLKDVIKQVYLMTSFCKIANIPFTVLAFTNGISDSNPEKAAVEALKDKIMGPRYISYDDNLSPEENRAKKAMTVKELDIEMFRVVEILSHKMSKDEYNKMGALLFSEVYKNVSNYKLASTPLNESLLYMLDFLPKFKKMNNVQKLSFIVLTDGEGHSLAPRRFESYSSYSRDGKSITKHLFLRKNNKDYEFKAYMQTGAAIQMIKDQDPNTTCLAFSLLRNNRRHISNTLSHISCYSNGGEYKSADESAVIKIAKDFKELGASALTKINAYDEYYLIPIENVKPESLNIANDLNSLTEKTASQIAKSFTKLLKQNRNSRFLLTSFAKQVA